MQAAGNLAEALRQKAIEFGFSACAFTTPNAIPDAAGRLAAFLNAGYHGQMGWLADRAGWLIGLVVAGLGGGPAGSISGCCRVSCC